MEGVDGKINYVLSQPGPQAAVHQLNIGNSGQAVSDVEQYQAIQGAVGSVIQLDATAIQTVSQATSPKKGTWIYLESANIMLHRAHIKRYYYGICEVSCC